MNFAFDQDDTMWPVIEPFLAWFNENNGTKIRFSQVKTFELQDLLGVKPTEVYDLFMEFYCHDSFRKNKFFKGARSSMTYWHKRGCRFYNPTSKPETPEIVEATEYMLSQIRGVVAEVFYLGRHCNATSHDRKVDICRKVSADVFADDHHINVLEVSQALNIPCILHSRPWNKSFDTRPYPLIARAYDWEDIHSILSKIFKGTSFRINEVLTY
jgi:uncharacterized HAD superfamily protein